MNKFIIFIIVSLFSLSADAQEYKVTMFKQLLFDLSGSTHEVKDYNDESAALIKVLYPKPQAVFDGNVITTDFKNGEYWVYVPKGTKRLKIYLPEQPTITLEFGQYGIQSVEGKMTYAIYFKREAAISTSFYIDGGFSFGSMTGPAVALGLYVGNFNIEAEVLVPMGGKETVYWLSDNQVPIACEYKPSLSFGGKIGYGIMAGESFRITPQVGMRYMSLTETSNGNATPAKGANNAALTIGCKLQYMISKGFGISLTPEYAAAMMKSNGFKALSDVSCTINGWNNGIGAKLSLNVEF